MCGIGGGIRRVGDDRLDYMCKAVEEYANKARQEGILETIVSLVHDGLLSVTEAAKRTSLSVEEIQKLTAQES